jgi:hypothetical protein
LLAPEILAEMFLGLTRLSGLIREEPPKAVAGSAPGRMTVSFNTLEPRAP